MLYVLKKLSTRKAIVAALAMLSSGVIVAAQGTGSGGMVGGTGTGTGTGTSRGNPTDSQGQTDDRANQGGSQQPGSNVPRTGRTRDTSQTEQTQGVPTDEAGTTGKKSRKNKRKGQGASNTHQNSTSANGTDPVTGSQDNTTNSGNAPTKRSHGDGNGTNSNSPNSTRP